MMKSGFFNRERQGGYTIENPDLIGAYEYNLMGRDMLVCLDQNGFVKIQAYPPDDILLLRREQGEKYGKWLTFIVKSGRIYCNFNRPADEEAESCKIEYLPEKAVYRYRYPSFEIATTIFVPETGCDVVCDVAVTNFGEEEVFRVYPQVYPFVNAVNASAWDPPCWYHRTALSHDKDKNLTFFTRLMNPKGIAEKRRNVGFYMSGGAESAEYFMERYVGCGDFFRPDAVCKNAALGYDFSFGGKFSEMREYNSIAGFQEIYAAKYTVKIKREETKHFVQVFSLLDNNGGEIPSEQQAAAPKRYFSPAVRAQETEKVKASYDRLFSLNRVESGDGRADDYINAFLPLQMKWIAALDRGWPTGMRGTRDASNDFMGLMIYDSPAARKTLLHLFDCQRSDGWFPRQIGKEKSGPHDLREYVDGGAFVLEFLYEYVCYAKDFALLREETGWLDRPGNSPLFEHALRALDYYAAEENIGEDGLCKIREGDWFDGINQAGIEGRGESVTVSCQFVMAYKYLRALFERAGIAASWRRYERAAEGIVKAVREKAYNAEGWFNGLKNDAGEWIFSNRDPDGAKRMFAVPNAFAVFSGIADGEQRKRVIENFERLKTDTGYKLFSPPFQKKLDHVGRVACGDVIAGLLGNYTVYNHGSQAFPVRACCAAGDGEKAKEIFSWLLPYDERRHPEEKTHNAPYAIVNCYHDVPPCRHRAGFSFLTGTVAMAVRIVYNFICGIKPCASGLEIDPCLPADAGEVKVKYNYHGNALFLHYRRGTEKRVTCNGKEASVGKDILTERKTFFLSEELLRDGAKIEITL